MVGVPVPALVIKDRFMTMMLLTKRDSFSALAIERMHGRPVSFSPKFVLHPNLPLAFGYGGCAHWPLNGNGASARERLEAFCREINSADDLVVSSLADRLRDLVQPAMGHMRDVCQIGIALVRDGRGDAGMLQIGSQEAGPEVTSLGDIARFLAPPIINDFVGERLGRLHDSALAEPAAVCAEMRAIIRDSIEAERVASGGENMAIGGEIDVVLVTREAARRQ
jgi:hypothetical protein